MTAPDSGRSHDGRAAGCALGTWLDALASDRPTPAGGAAAAAAGALSAAVVAMVARGTARHGGGSGAERTVADAERLRSELTALIDDDVEAYQEVMEARRSPASERGPRISEALRRATAVPLAVARAAHALLRCCDGLVETTRPDALSDLEVATTLAAATVEGASCTARANLRSLAADAAAGESERLAALVAEAAALSDRVRRRLECSAEPR